MNWLLAAVPAVLTPAVVASIVTLFFNIKAEKRRAERDFITKMFDAARDDVRRAVEYAVDYFPKTAAKRTPEIEAKLWMGERDVRHSVTACVEFSKEGSGKDALQRALDDFIDALTGGSFQSAQAKPDMEQVRQIASTGATLRAAIAVNRQLELRDAISSDVVSRGGKVAAAYLNTNMGPAKDTAALPK